MSIKQKMTNSFNRIVIIFLILVAVVYILQIIPTNYIVHEPGIAEEVRPMVNVPNGYNDEQGEFLLTTVYMSYPNLLGYIRANLSRNAEIFHKSQFWIEGETESDYARRQEINMLSSQSNAIMAVYNHLNIPYEMKNEGIYIENLSEDFPAAHILKPWDQIMKVDGNPVYSYEDLVAAFADKKAGDIAVLTIKRNDTVHEEQVQLAQLPQESGTTENHKPRVGLGAAISVLQRVVPEDSRYEVSISADEIGGPSAGLMFALEIFNRLVAEDITKGYRIAGTGVIDSKGAVGVIGGIRHKVVAADEARAEYFLAPSDFVPDDPQYETIPNYSDAVSKAKEIGSPMKVIEIASLQEALEFLDRLPKKNKR